MKAQVSEFKRFMRTHNISQHRAAEVLELSQPSISKLFRGQVDHLSVHQRSDVLQRMIAWMDEYNQAEAWLYQRIMPLCRDVPRSVVRSTMHNIIRDLQSL